VGCWPLEMSYCLVFCFFFLPYFLCFCIELRPSHYLEV
jgi:hypothetical protein